MSSKTGRLDKYEYTENGSPRTAYFFECIRMITRVLEIALNTSENAQNSQKYGRRIDKNAQLWYSFLY